MVLVRLAWLLAVALSLAFGGAAFAQPAVNYAIPNPTNPQTPVSAVMTWCWSGVAVVACGGSAASPVTTYQGTLSVTASVAVSTLTLSNSTVFPAGSLGKMTIINTGATNTAYVCWFGGTCSASGGSEPLAPGASDTVNLGAATTSPTVFATSSTTLAIHN